MTVIQIGVRPCPPASMSDIDQMMRGVFVPDQTFEAWIRACYIAEDGPLFDRDHAHLAQASLGVLWTNAENTRQTKRIVGTAEIPQFRGSSGWTKARQEHQMQEWFGELPDFVLTFDAIYCGQASDREFCSLVDHEMRHCVQATDEFGEPRFNKTTGRPIFGVKAHDVEEFTAVVSRFGIEAGAGDAVDLVIAAARPFSVSDAMIAQACGRASVKGRVERKRA